MSEGEWFCSVSAHCTCLYPSAGAGFGRRQVCPLRIVVVMQEHSLLERSSSSDERDQVWLPLRSQGGFSVTDMSMDMAAWTELTCGCHGAQWLPRLVGGVAVEPPNLCPCTLLTHGKPVPGLKMLKGNRYLLQNAKQGLIARSQRREASYRLKLGPQRLALGCRRWSSCLQ